MTSLNLTQREIDYIGRVVETEVPRSIARRNPDTYADMVKAVTDTIINRVASPSFPNTVEGVINQNRQFSKIAGPKSYKAKNGKRIALNPYGKVSKAPKASELVQNTVNSHIQARINGAPSIVGGALHYANPAYSSRSNQGWISKLDGPRLGVGTAVHHHGTAPGYKPAPEVTLSAEGFGSSPATQLAQSDIPVPAQRPQQFDAGGILNPDQVPSMSLINEAQALPVPDSGGLLRDYSNITSQTPANAYVDQSPLEAAPVDRVQRASLRPAIRPRDIAASSPVGALPSSPPEVPVDSAMADMSRMTQGLGQTPQDQINTAGLLALPRTAPSIPQPAQRAPQAPQDLPEPRRVQTVSIRPETPQADPIGAINQSELLSLPSGPPQIGGVPIAGPTPNSDVLANPESYPDELTYQQAVAAQPLPMAQPMPSTPLAPFPATPQPVQAPVAAVAPPQAFPPAPQAMAPSFAQAPSGGAFPSAPEPYQPPTASGMDVWQGRALEGIASDGTQLTRAANGDVYRYNPTYDHTQRVGPDGAAIGGVMPGRVEGPANQGSIGLSMPSFPSIGQPQTQMGSMVRGAAGSVAGGMLGGLIAGPLGGLLGSAVGSNLARGQGILGNNGRQITGARGNPYPNAPSRTNDGISEAQRQRNIDRSEQSGRFSSRAIDAARTGRGGLF